MAMGGHAAQPAAAGTREPGYGRCGPNTGNIAANAPAPTPLGSCELASSLFQSARPRSRKSRTIFPSAVDDGIHFVSRTRLAARVSGKLAFCQTSTAGS